MISVPFDYDKASNGNLDMVKRLDSSCGLMGESDRFEVCSGVDRTDEAADLLEDFWFFDNLLSRKSSILRSDSEIFQPNLSREMSEKSAGSESSSTTLNPRSSPPSQWGDEEVTEKERCLGEGELLVTPAQAPSMEDKGGAQANEICCTGKRENRRRKLVRTPSLPPYFGREDQNQFVQKETEFRSRNSSRKNDFQSIPTKHEGNAQITRVPKYRLPDSMKSRKSLGNLESEEVQGFRDLGFKFEEEEITQSVIEILPGLRRRETEDVNVDEVRRPYLSEAWHYQSYSPPFPKWIARSSSAEDMKSQIKFWAKAVASNVHHPVS